MISSSEVDPANGTWVYFNMTVLYLALGSYLNEIVSKVERRAVAQRIRAKWRRVGQVLGPDPTFEDHELDGFEEKRDNRDRAQAMLDAWAEKHHKKATRTMLIIALKEEGYGLLISDVFNCNPDNVK